MHYRRVFLLTGLLLFWHGLAAAETTRIMDFLGKEGCTVDDAVRAKAVKAGLDSDAVDARIATALDDGDAETHGAWTVLSATICTIRIPEIEAPFQLEDQTVKAFTSAPGAFEHPGCFISGAELLDHLVRQNNQGKDRAQDAYLQLLASGIFSGKLRFYSDDPLVTPPGFQVFNGSCSDLPNLAAIQRNHALLVQHFGTVIRAVGKSAKCDGDVMAIVQREAAALPGNTNAWMFHEIMVIAMAAGWFDGLTYSDRGVPRPPLCHS